MFANVAVYLQTHHRTTGAFAALKQVAINDATELEDYVVEIDILTENKHRNVVDLYEAFYFQDKLWVSLSHPCNVRTLRLCFLWTSL